MLSPISVEQAFLFDKDVTSVVKYRIRLALIRDTSSRVFSEVNPISTGARSCMGDPQKESDVVFIEAVAWCCDHQSRFPPPQSLYMEWVSLDLSLAWGFSLDTLASSLVKVDSVDREESWRNFSLVSFRGHCEACYWSARTSNRFNSFLFRVSPSGLRKYHGSLLLRLKNRLRTEDETSKESQIKILYRSWSTRTLFISVAGFVQVADKEGRPLKPYKFGSCQQF